MGKSLELLGLAAFNVFIALILSATFLGKSQEPIGALTESHIEKFINDVTQISGGLRQDMDPYSITGYFMDHIAENSTFASKIEYQMPGTSAEGQMLEMGKLDFISHVLQGMKIVTKHEAAVEIEYIKIENNGKSALVTTTSHERGIMPVEDETGEARMMPVTGTSYCEQKLILSSKKLIQMAGATCSTSIGILDSF